MKRTIRILTAILAIIMLVPAAVSCANTNDPEETQGNAITTAPEAGNQQTDPTEVETQIVSDIPADLKFTGETVRILYWDDVENPEFFVDDTNGEAVNDAIYTRNERVQDQFGITLDYVGTPGNYNNQAAFINTCTNSTQSGSDAHDIFAGYSMTGATLMTKALAQDLTQYEIIEFDKPWWPSTLISKATIKDAVYFASGDISTNYLYMMYSMFFNKDMFTDLHGDHTVIYDLVYDQQWTLDKLIEYSTGVFMEQNQDDQASEGDRFGFVTINIHFDAFYTGAGLSTVVTADDGSLVLSEDFYSQKATDLVAKVCAFIHDSGDSWKLNNSTIFKQDQALFTCDRVHLASRHLKEVDFSFGIIPVPKYDLDQEDYQTCMAFPFTTYVLSVAAPAAEAAAATLELLAYQSYLLVTPALFEESMKLRYADAGDDSLMYDIIRRTVVIDLGRLLTTQVNNYSYSVFRGAVNDNAAGRWDSAKKANGKLFEKKIAAVNTDIDKLG